MIHPDAALLLFVVFCFVFLYIIVIIIIIIDFYYHYIYQFHTAAAEIIDVIMIYHISGKTRCGEDRTRYAHNNMIPKYNTTTTSKTIQDSNRRTDF